MSFRIVYPASDKITFDGGMNSKFEKTLIEDNESPDCLNVTFGAGSVGSREGFVQVNTAAVGSFVCDGLYTRKGTGSAETMVAFYGGNGYTLDGTSLVTIPSAQGVLTAGVRVAAAQMENHIFICNGYITPYKYNGTNFTRHGVPQPSGTVSFNSNGAGNPNGEYRYKFTYVNSQSVEGNPTDATSTFTVASKIINVSDIPVAPTSWGVSARRIYRTVTSGSAYLRVAEISDNTTTSYDDNIADGSLGVAAPSEKGEPPKYNSIVYHQGRLFMNDLSNEGLVWYTDINEPYTVASTNFLTVGDQSSDFVKALGVYNNILAVFCQQNVWLFYMPSTTPSEWVRVKSKSPYSSRSQFGLFEFNNMLGFPAMQNDKFLGVAALTDDSIQTDATYLMKSAVKSDLQSERVEPDMFDIQESYVQNFSSIVFKNVAYISMTKAAGNTTNNRVYIMDFSLENLKAKQSIAWSPWSGLNVAQFTVYAGVLYYGSSTSNGLLYKQNSGVSSDNGTAINAYYWTKEFGGRAGDEELQKDFRFTNLLVDLAGAYFMDFAVRTDSDSGTGTNYQIDLDPNSSLWGSMVWGVDPWGAGALQQDFKMPLAGASGKRIQFKFSNQNTAGQRFKVHWQKFTYNKKGPR